MCSKSKLSYPPKLFVVLLVNLNKAIDIDGKRLISNIELETEVGKCVQRDKL